MPMLADHVLDLDEKFYKSAGVSRLHDVSHLDPEEVEEGDVVFVKTDFLYNGYFRSFIFPRIQNPFILISGVSSYQLGPAGDKHYKSMIEDEKIIKWFCTNPPKDYSSEKIIPLPIGFEERERPGGDQKLITKYHDKRTSFVNKKNKILLPYHDLSTNDQRQCIFESLRSLPFVEVQKEKLPWEKYIQLVDEYKFVICLEGSGPDVHRNYECLLVNSIPVNMKNAIKKVFDYHSLPGIFVDSWGELVSQNFENYCEKEYCFDNINKFMKIKYFKKIMDKFRGEQE